MALGDERRASGAANEAARRATGSNNEANRRAGGDAMEARRRSSTIKNDLNALETPTRQRAQLRNLESRGARPLTRGVGNWDPKNQPATTGGIASPLTEKTKDQGGSPVADREYYSAGLVSSDGLLVLPAIKKQTFTDANGAEEVRNYATPGVI